MIANVRLVALTFVTECLLQTFDNSFREFGEFIERFSIDFEIGTEGVTDLRFRSAASRILAQHVDAPLAAELFHSRAMMARHRENYVRLLRKFSS